MASSQPEPTIHCPSGSEAAERATACMISEIERTAGYPASISPRKMPFAHCIACVWTSISPGRTVCRCKSSIRVRELAQGASASSSPSARILPSRTAMALTTLFAPPIVMMWPLRRRRSASRHVRAGPGVNLRRGVMGLLNALALRVLESCRGIHPQEQGLLFAEALPAVRLCAFKVQAVSRFDHVALNLIHPHFELALKNINELLPLMAVGPATGGAWSDPKEVGFHDLLAEGKQLHLYPRVRCQDLALARPHKPARVILVRKKGQDVCLIKPRQLLQGGDGGVSVTMFQRTQKAHADSRLSGDCRQSQPVFPPQLP